VRLWQSNKNLKLDVKSIIVAAGIRSYTPEKGMFGYGVFSNVVTNLEFERLMNAGGPTGGEIIRLQKRASCPIVPRSAA